MFGLLNLLPSSLIRRRKGRRKGETLIIFQVRRGRPFRLDCTVSTRRAKIETKNHNTSWFDSKVAHHTEPRTPASASSPPCWPLTPLRLLVYSPRSICPPSLGPVRRIGSRRGSKSENTPPPPPAGNSTSHGIGNPNASSESSTPSATPTPPPRPSTSIAPPKIRSESPPSVVQRRSFGRKFGRGATSAGNTPPRAEQVSRE